MQKKTKNKKNLALMACISGYLSLGSLLRNQWSNYIFIQNSSCIYLHHYMLVFVEYS